MEIGDNNTDRIERLDRLAALERRQQEDSAFAQRIVIDLAEVEQRTENLVASMREVAGKDNLHASVRFLADTIALALAASTNIRADRDPPGRAVSSSVNTVAGDTSGRMIRLWTFVGAGPRVWGSESEARAAAWEDYDARG